MLFTVRSVSKPAFDQLGPLGDSQAGRRVRRTATGAAAGDVSAADSPEDQIIVEQMIFATDDARYRVALGQLTQLPGRQAFQAHVDRHMPVTEVQ